MAVHGAHSSCPASLLNLSLLASAPLASLASLCHFAGPCCFAPAWHANARPVHPSPLPPPVTIPSLPCLTTRIWFSSPKHPKVAVDSHSPLFPATPEYPQPHPCALLLPEPPHRLYYQKRADGGHSSLPALYTPPPLALILTFRFPTRPCACPALSSVLPVTPMPRLRRALASAPDSVSISM